MTTDGDPEWCSAAPRRAHDRRAVAGFAVKVAAGGLLAGLVLVWTADACFVMTRFSLVPHGRTFALKDAVHKNAELVVIPRDWLIPPQEEADAEDLSVNPFAYHSKVTAFMFGPGKWGLRLASYDIMKSGSLQAAAGRDVFLVYDQQTRQVQPGLITLGVTMDRARAEGCMAATATHFLVGDVQGDGISDIGVVRERIACEKGAARDPDLEPPVFPRYRQEPIQWFVFEIEHGQWRHDPRHEGKFPQTVTEMPLIGMHFTPVDFAACMHQPWRSYDPRRWHAPEETDANQSDKLFVPAYRKKLIALGTKC